MNNKRVKLPGFLIWLCQNGQLDEAFLLLQGADAEALKNKELDAEATARLKEMYGPYRDSFGEVEAPTFEKAVSEVVEVWCRLTAPVAEANVTASDREAEPDGDEKPEMNAEAKAELQESLLMLIEAHNDVAKALHSNNVKFDAIGVQWVLSVLLKLLNVGTQISHMARLYGLSAECVHGKGNILVDWEEVCKDERLTKRFLTEEDLSEDEPENDPEDEESED